MNLAKPRLNDTRQKDTCPNDSFRRVVGLAVGQGSHEHIENKNFVSKIY
ncbi:MAG: hypothetical protein WC599_07425 [Bacteroidales bacterium]